MSQTPSPGIEPATRAFLDMLAKAGGPPIYKLSVADARQVLVGAQTGGPDRLEAEVEEKTIPAGPMGSVSLRIYRPKSAAAAEALPVVMYFHGGGWVLGDWTTHDRLVREIVHGTNAAVVFVNYSPSPEALYPTAIEEAYAATKWIAENGAGLGLDPTRLAVAGDSVGGNMAIAVTMLAKKHEGPRICFQVLFYPVTDANFETGSYNAFAEGHFLTREAMKWFWDSYAPDPAERDEPTASPLRAASADLQGLPPAFVATAEFDVLRDEGEAYAHKLSEAGVRVTAVRCLGAIHDFVMLNALAATPAARAATAQACQFLRTAFSD